MPNPLKGEFVLNKEEKDETAEIKAADKPTPKLASIHPKSKPHFFSSFAPFPEGIIMQDQEADEEIILLIRRHFITNLPWILIAIITSIFPLLLAPFIPTFLPFVIISPLSQTLLTAFYYLIIAGYVLINFSIWYFNIALVTNKRIVDLDVTGILFRHVAETNLDLVQDVSYSQNGAIRSIFDYGDILVQTAGSLPNFEFDRAPHPAEIIKIIGDYIGKRP